MNVGIIGACISILVSLFVFYLVWDTKQELRAGDDHREERFRRLVASLLNQYVKQAECEEHVSKTDEKLDSLSGQLQEVVKLCRACHDCKPTHQED